MAGGSPTLECGCAKRREASVVRVDRSVAVAKQLLKALTNRLLCAGLDAERVQRASRCLPSRRLELVGTKGNGARRATFRDLPIALPVVWALRELELASTWLSRCWNATKQKGTILRGNACIKARWAPSVDRGRPLLLGDRRRLTIRPWPRQEVFPRTVAVVLICQPASDVDREQARVLVVMDLAAVLPLSLDGKPYADPRIQGYVDQARRCAVVLKHCKLIKNRQPPPVG